MAKVMSSFSEGYGRYVAPRRSARRAHDQMKSKHSLFCGHLNMFRTLENDVSKAFEVRSTRGPFRGFF